MMTGTDAGANGCAGVPADEQRARLETEVEERQRELITLQDAHDKLLAEMQRAECPRFPVLPFRIRRAFLCAFLRRVMTASCLAGDEAARPA